MGHTEHRFLLFFVFHLNLIIHMFMPPSSLTYIANHMLCRANCQEHHKWIPVSRIRY